MSLFSSIRKLFCSRESHSTPEGFCDLPRRRRLACLAQAPNKYKVPYKPDNKFHVAACRGNIEKMHSLLVLQIFRINHRDKSNRTALHFACFHGNLELVAILVESNCEINPRDSQENTPLMKAVQRQKDKIVHYLLRHGADPNIKDCKGETALHHAIYFGRTVLAERLLDYGADIETMTEDGFTPLLLALRENQADVAKYLLKRGANVHVCDHRQRNTLMYAVRNDLPEMVHLLLWRGVDFTFSDDFGWNALRYAVTGRRNVMSIMFDYEAVLFENGLQDIKNFEDSCSTRTASLMTFPSSGDTKKMTGMSSSVAKNITTIRPEPLTYAETDLEVISLDDELF